LIPMPPRRTTADALSIGAAKCLRLACERHFPRTTIGAVAEVVSGGTPDTANASLWNGDVVWVTPRDLGRPRHVEIDDSERHLAPGGIPGRHLLPVGTVLLSSRAPIGHLGIAARPLCTNQGFKNIICSATLHNRYLFHLLRASIDELEAEGRGNTFKEIPSRVVSSFEIPLPPVMLQQAVAEFLDAFYLRLAGQPQGLPLLPSPLEEQRGIVARIELLATRIQQTRELQRAATTETAALMQAARNDVIRGYESVQPRVALGDICTSITDGPHVSPSYVEAGIPFISVRNISEFGLDFSNAKYVTPEDHELYSKKAPVERGDVLYTKGGTTGVARRVDTDRPFSIWVHVALLKLKRGRTCAAFVEHALNSPLCKEQALQFTHGSSNKDLGLTRMCNIVFPLPPLEEQEAAARKLDDLQSRCLQAAVNQDKAAAELDALLPSIFDKAFKGEL
jgi:type I restriction enzyme S subunit